MTSEGPFQPKAFYDSVMSATQKFMSRLKRYLCKMSLSVMTGKGSPLQVPDNRS